MTFGDAKLPRATLRGENLYVECEKEPYFRDPESTISLRVDALTIYRGYESEDPIKLTGKVLTESLHGIAKLEGKNRFAVVGLETDRKTPIKFQLWPVSDTETKFHWRATIGFDHQHLFRKAGFWIRGNCERQHFDDLLAAVRRGHVDNILIGMETTMWTNKAMHRPSERAWHLAPPTNNPEPTQPAVELGYISSLKWEEKFGLRPAKETEDDLTAPKPQVIELPARIYSMLSALVAIGAVLLVLTFVLAWTLTGVRR